MRAESGEKRLGANKPSQTLRFTGGDENRAEEADLLFGQRMSLRTDGACQAG